MTRKFDFDKDGNLIVGGVTFTDAEIWEMLAVWGAMPEVKSSLALIVGQLKKCGYVCEGGPIELNEAFIALAALAEN